MALDQLAGARVRDVTARERLVQLRQADLSEEALEGVEGRRAREERASALALGGDQRSPSPRASLPSAAIESGRSKRAIASSSAFTVAASAVACPGWNWKRSTLAPPPSPRRRPRPRTRATSTSNVPRSTDTPRTTTGVRRASSNRPTIPGDQMRERAGLELVVRRRVGVALVDGHLSQTRARRRPRRRARRCPRRARG